jgi:transcription elongation factor Elf1
MSKEFPTREEDGELIKKSFSSTKFSCIRCGLQNIEINEIQPYPSKGREAALSVTALLFCRRCNHRFYVKILDQGARNTDVYFNNTL